MPPKAATNPKTRKKRGHSSEDGEDHRTKAHKIKVAKVIPPAAKTQKAPKLPRGLRGARGVKLKQLQYHKFEDDVVIYHYAASFISVPNFRSLLTRQQHGYVNYLLGPDPLSSTPTPPGDEPPSGCLEVGYLPSVFVLGGSALGFRIPSSPSTIEWLCFDRDIRKSILELLDINTSTQHMLFEHVASLPRAPPPEKKWDRRLAYTEHKDWFESLREAGRRPFKLGLTWRTWGSEMMIEGMKKRDEQVRLKERRGIMGGVVAVNAEDYSDVEEEDESPETLGRRTPFVYRDPNWNVTPQKTSRSSHSRSSSNASALSNRSANTLQTQPPSSTETKSKERRLLDGGYV